MSGPRAQNPSANAAPPPASGQKTSESSAKGSSKSKYQEQCEADNPAPTDDQKDKPKVSLANCRFETPLDELKLNEEFEFAVDVKKIGDPKTRRAYFDLYCTRTRDGKDDRARIWARKEATPQDDKADPMVAKGKAILETQSDYKLGEPVKFELECSHDEADEICKSKPVEIKLMTKAFWIGGDDLFFRNDGEFPLLREDGSMIQVLSAAIQRVEAPPQKDADTTICFGFASAAGNPDPNRKLSLRRAQVVKAILERDSAAWTDLAKANFETVDMQQFLSDLHKTCGWECDPGAVDGQAGPKTKSAVESFQKECNGRYKLGLKEDGVAGPKTWGAVLRVIHGQIQAGLGLDPTKEPSWKKPKWGNGGKGVYACGEDYATDGDKPEERTVQITFFSPGSEPALVDVADGQKPSPTDNPVQQKDRVEKVKVEKGAATSHNSTPDPDPDNEVVYDPATDKFSIFDKEMVAILEKFEGYSKKLAPYNSIKLTHKHPKSQELLSDDDLTVWIWAVNDVEAQLFSMNELSKIDAFMQEIDKKMASRFDQGKAKLSERRAAAKSTQDAVLEPGYKINNGSIKEYFRVGNKRAVWGWGGEQVFQNGKSGDKKWNWTPRDQILRSIREERAKAKQAEKQSAEDEANGKKAASEPAEKELKLYEVKLFDEKGGLLPSVDRFFQDHCINIGSGTKNLDLSVSASMFRYAAEAAYGASFNWKETKKVKIGAKVEASFSAAQAAGAFTTSFPSKDGLDLIKFIQKVDPKFVTNAADASLLVLLELQIKGNAFLGANASASLEAGVELKSVPKANSAAGKSGAPEVGLEAGCDLFAGAKAAATGSIAFKAKLRTEKQIASKTPISQVEWTTISEASYGVWAAWGIGLTAGFKLGYFNGLWVYQGKLGVVVKGGCGQEIKGTLDAQAFFKLAYNLFEAIQWRNIESAIEKSALTALEGVLLHCFITGQNLANGAVELGKLKDDALRDLVRTANSTLTEWKRLDDNLDKYLPGYSGFKQFNAPYLLLRETYQVVKQQNLKLTAKEQAIHWVRNADVKKTWIYATWKMKANLIFDLGQNGSGWLGGFSEEDSEECIIKVLKTSRSDWEFGKIIQSLKSRGVDIDSCLDWKEQDELDQLKQKYHYRGV